MFGKNEVVGKKFFEDAPQRSLMVTSIFTTIQGEGPYAGYPATFIRLSKCNLSCIFCDTYFDSGEYYNYEDLKDKVLLSQGDLQYQGTLGIVITGGEPLLQSANLSEFIDYLVDEIDPNFIQIESNGIPAIGNKFTKNCDIVISPKAVVKYGKEISYIKPSDDLLKRCTALKFVVTSDVNSLYNTIPDWANAWAWKVFVSPMNIYNDEPRAFKEKRVKNDITIEERSELDEVVSFWTPGLLNMEENQKNHEYAAKLALMNGYRLNLQMHLYCSLA